MRYLLSPCSIRKSGFFRVGLTRERSQIRILLSPPGEALEPQGFRASFYSKSVALFACILQCLGAFWGPFGAQFGARSHKKRGPPAWSRGPPGRHDNPRKREEIIMLIQKNISLAIQRYRAKHHLSLAALSKAWGIPISSLQCYIKGTSNPRADTLEILANKMQISLFEMVSGQALEWEKTEIIVRAAKEFAGLPKIQRSKGTYLFFQLVALFDEDI